MANIKGEQRKRIIRRDWPICAYCGSVLEHDQVAIDHVVPQCDGGTDDDHNLVVACYHCNGVKAHHSVEQFREALQLAAIGLVGQNPRAMVVARIAMRRPITFFREERIENAQRAHRSSEVA